MKIKKHGLIMGHAALFAASVVGCEASDTSDTEGGNGDAQQDIPRDMRTVIDDAQSGDSELPELDMETISDASSTPTDMSHVDPTDQGTLPDVSPMMDMAIVDVDQGAQSEDAGVPDDAAVVVDASPIVDAAPPLPDVAPPQGCAQFVGDPCRSVNDGCCENNQPMLVCRGGQFVDPGPDEFACGCESPEGMTQVFCAVPGFVGIAQAGRRRRGARRLRDLLV